MVAVSRRTYAAAAAGFTGASFGWLLGQPFDDLGAVISGYRGLDLVILAVLGGCIGGASAAMTALREERRIARSVGIGVAAGAGGAAAIGLVAVALIAIVRLDDSPVGFVIARLFLWTATAAALAAILAITDRKVVPRQAVPASMMGAAGGFIGGVVFTLPGPTVVWQLVAFLIVGLAVGIATASRRRPAAVLESVGPDHRPRSLFADREWDLVDGSTTPIGALFEIRTAGGHHRIGLTQPGAAPVSAAGRSIENGAEIRIGDVVRVGDREFRVCPPANPSR